MARLLYVPIMHGGVDLGSTAKAYEAAFVARFGEEKWRERCEEYSAIWRSISKRLENAISREARSPKQVRLYQDSLPVCGREQALVAELAAQGSENHRLLQRLVERGAILVGTESSELLIEEYRLLRTADHTREQADAILQARDRYIAERIEATLGEGELGVLFIGALHAAHKHLTPRIQVEYLAINGG